jgi:hypothetical protein
LTPLQLLAVSRLIGQITATFFAAPSGVLSQINCAGDWGSAGRFRRCGEIQVLEIS